MSNGENRAFLALCRVVLWTFMVRCKGKEGETMDTKKIGEFLKLLRKEKGLTQEQLAEILLVSGRTISRWETGTNMPDLSAIIQIAEFYEVDVKEILDGERKGENMDLELKETLTKVADYSKLEKEKAVRTGNMAFGLSFMIGAITIIVQLTMIGNLKYVAGETAVLLISGIVYLGMMSYHGIYATDSGLKNSPFTDAVISIVCAILFTIVLAVYYAKMGADVSRIVYAVLLFFVGISIAGFVVLRMLAYFSHKRRRKIL